MSVFRRPAGFAARGVALAGVPGGASANSRSLARGERSRGSASLHGAAPAGPLALFSGAYDGAAPATRRPGTRSTFPPCFLLLVPAGARRHPCTPTFATVDRSRRWGLGETVPPLSRRGPPGSTPVACRDEAQTARPARIAVRVVTVPLYVRSMLGRGIRSEGRGVFADEHHGRTGHVGCPNVPDL